MLEYIYLGFFILGLASLILYKFPKFTLYAGFGLSAVWSLFAALYFLSNLNDTYGFTLGGNFISKPSFIITPLGGFFSFLVMFVVFATSIYSIGYTKKFAKNANLAVFVALFVFLVLSILLIISSDNVFSFIVFWEFMTILSALLLKFKDEENSNNTVMIYLGVAQCGVAFIMIGLMLMASFAHSFSFSNWMDIEVSSLGSCVVLALLLIGFGSKAGVFPFHIWSPLTYPLAPSNISAIMSGLMSKMSVFGLIKFGILLPMPSSIAMVMMGLGAFSALFGIVYALNQKEYKKLIAYSSIENIGIIFLGLGATFYGISIGEPNLILLGFIGTFYHMLNHATFKSLLFFGAGSLHAITKTKEINSLGGLAKKLPFTAFLFLIATLSISALPPLNGFMGEWFIYRAMLAAGLDDGLLSRLVFTLSIVALALTGALVVYCFIKLYGFIFAGVPKDIQIYNFSCEKSFFMPFGMAILALLCVVFGLGANVVVEKLSQVALSIMQMSQYEVSVNVLSMPLIAMVLLFLMLLPFVFFMIFGANSSKPKFSDPWACGFKYSSKMQMNSNSFVGDFRKLVSNLIGAKSEFKQKDYFSNVSYSSNSSDIWWKILYKPIVVLNVKIADKLALIQNGKTSFYVVYILAYLYIMLVVAFYLLGA